MLRRPDQVTNPYVWAEESFILRNFLDGGVIATALTPVQGQLIFTTGLGEGLFLAISPEALPQLEYLGATLVFLFTIGLLLFAPLTLPLWMRVLFALAMALVPADPETFGVWLYSFWWISLWPLILIFWDEPNLKITIPIMVLAGVSSLAAAALFPIYLFRGLLERKVPLLILGALLASTFVLQIGILLSSSRSEDEALMVLASIRQVIEYPAEYLVVWLPELTAGFALMLGLVVWIILAAITVSSLLSSHRNVYFTSLMGGLVIFSCLSALPEPIISEPDTSAGSRYFFLPFVALTWTFLLWWSFLQGPVRRVAPLLLVLGLLTLGVSFSRPHATLNWKQELTQACSGDSRPSAIVPIHLDGDAASTWELNLDQEDCKKLLR